MTLAIKAASSPLWPHQRDGFERFKDVDLMPLFWDMRLGKSLLTVRWLRYRHRALGLKPRILLVAPLTPMIDWMDLLEREWEPYAVARGSKAKRLAAFGDGVRWTLITYDSVIHTKDLFKVDWTAIVLDESTRIKNPSAKVTRTFLKQATDGAPIRAILTGIPAPQRFSEIWAQMAWINGGSWMGFSNFWRWRDKYSFRAGFEIVMTGKNLSAVKAAAHAQGYFLSRKQAGLANVKIRQRRCGHLTPEVRKIYKDIVTKWEVPGVETKTSLVVSGWLRRLAGGFLPGGEVPCWKYDELVQLLEEDFHGEQVVVWYAHNPELERSHALLQARGVRAEKIRGTVDLDERKAIVRRFRAGDCRVLLCQVACGKYGLDLSVSDTAIYFSNADSYENRAQSEDRVEHVAKRSELLYVDLVTQNTADEDVLEGLAEKRGDAAYFASKIKLNGRTG